MPDFEYRFHPVGHGLFASGTLSNGEDCQWVFDCGSLKKATIHAQICDYTNRYNSKKHIDVLCISHFDRDHVNGLSKLLENCTVGRIVIPHVCELTRLYYIWKNKNAHDPDYIKLLQNIIQYIIDNARFEGNDPSIDILYTNEDLKNTNINGIACNYYNMKHSIPIGNDWKFVFLHHNAKKNSKGISQLLNALASHGQQKLQKILSYNNVIEELKLIYDNFVNHNGRNSSKYKGINESGVSLYAGPIINKSQSNRVINFKSCTCVPNNIANMYNNNFKQPTLLNNNSISILYTGDTSLRDLQYIQYIQGVINDYKKANWDSIAILQVPHHGSANSCIKTNNSIFPHIWSVFSADPEHPFGKSRLPNINVVNAMANRNPILVNVCVAIWKGQF